MHRLLKFRWKLLGVGENEGIGMISFTNKTAAWPGFAVQIRR